VGTTTELTAATNQNLGTIVTDQSGFTLYRFEKDTTDPPASNCDGQCAETWPPALVGPSGLAGVKLDDVSSSAIGVVTRADGTKQLTVAGHPVYRYAGDKAPGQTNGQDVGSTWFAITPTGDKALSDGAAQLNLAQSNALGTVVTDGDGFTLYRFNKDSNKPPTSNCSGQCAITWPPAIITTSTITTSGIDQALVGTITRADGSKQLTLDGWPLYEYTGDLSAGETNGQGVDGTWYAVTPTGAKNTTVLSTQSGTSSAPSASASAGYSSGY